jgi:uncharacterized membrane protein
MVIQNTTVQEQIDKYLLKLERNLKQLPKVEREDVLKEIKSHIYESISEDGIDKSEELENVLKKLGNPSEYAKLLISQHISEIVDKGSLEENFKTFFKQMFIPFIFSATILIFIMFSNTIFLYLGYFTKETPLLEPLKILMYNLPALIVLIIPMCVLYTVPTAFYTMVKSSENSNAIRAPKVWLMVILVGLIASITTLCINEFIVPSSNHKIVETSMKLLEMKETNPITFSNIKSVQEMSFFEAREKIAEKKAKGIETDKMEFDLFVKLSLPLVSFACAIFGAFVGCLLLSELFHKGYTVIVAGLIIPTFLMYYTFYAIPLNMMKTAPMSAFLPDLVVGSLGLLLILGVFLNKKTDKVV